MKKPTLKKFKEVSQACNGNITSIAKAFSVSRQAVYDWAKEDELFKRTIDDFKGALLDECVTMGRIVALGVPDRDETGKFIGWKERPDPSMLRYFMSTLGRKEGYGENVDLTTNGKDISTTTDFSNFSNEELKQYHTLLQKANGK